MKQLSIIIVNYNSLSFVQDCLNSLYAKKGIPESWEVIIVDNASKEKFKDQWIKDSSLPAQTGIQVIRNTENVGFAKANNQAIKKTQGKYVLLLNPDTIVSQEALKHLIEFMEQHGKAGIVTPKVVLPMGGIDDASHRGFPTPWRSFCYFSGLSALFPKSMLLNGYHLGYQNMDKPHQIEACVGACMLVRRTIGEQVGWLDEDYFWYGEDLDFCYKVHQAGHQIWYMPDVSILHFKGVTSGIKKDSQNITTADKSTRRKAQAARFQAMRIFYNKHYKNKYPTIVTSFVNAGISLLSKLYT